MYMYLCHQVTPPAMVFLSHSEELWIQFHSDPVSSTQCMCLWRDIHSS